MGLTKRLAAVVFLLMVSLEMTACANILPVPGGTEAANESYFKSADDLKARVEVLQPGMAEAEAFSNLGRTREEFLALDPEEIWRIGLGRGIIPAAKTRGWDATDALTGYRIRYKAVTRRHGLSSPVRIRTDESGFSYELTLLFRNGRLLDKPILSGGSVNEVRSHTLFDYLTPGTALNYATP